MATWNFQQINILDFENPQRDDLLIGVQNISSPYDGANGEFTLAWLRGPGYWWFENDLYSYSITPVGDTLSIQIVDKGTTDWIFYAENIPAHNGSIADNSNTEIGGTTTIVSGLEVDTPPVITDQSIDATVMVNAVFVLSVTATGVPSPGYQWYKNNILISGQIDAFLTSYTTKTAVYKCRVYNIAGETWSNDIVITAIANSNLNKPPSIFNLNSDLGREG